jgi:prepilin signal peptidase PulO-like enzyme (type II secretory pathway)
VTGWPYYILLFLVGTLAGSYLNVLGLRYSPEGGFKASRRGRSRCPYCQRPLRWFELVPLLSFVIQAGRCRSCRRRIYWQYPLVELGSGLMFVLVPGKFGFSLLGWLWLAAFLTLLLVAIIDFRFWIIPDKLNLFLVFLGLAIAGFYFLSGHYGLVEGKIWGSFLGSQAMVFWLGQTAIGQPSLWLNYLAGAVLGLVFVGGIYFLSGGRGMGFGDVKLAGAVGLLLGWPDIVLALALAFITGSLASLILLAAKRKRWHDSLPFGPFIVLGVTLVFFFGYHIVNGYFRLFNLY